MLALVEGDAGQGPFHDVAPEYRLTVGALKDRIEALRDARAALATERVGAGLERALNATFLSYLPLEDFAYPLPVHDDPRGRFAEMLKTRDSGQFSFFTAHPGVTRGGHYHHSKTEKFLVVRGQARFKFRHLVTGQQHSLEVSGEQPQVVETIPGWTHDITNIGAEEMIVMLWANEVFDRERPDTYAAAV
jgi:UDP-2-acetamido-2,6-beta-L-arabino-hexul-4-ose reductase